MRMCKIGSTIHIGGAMRTNIEIDDTLMTQAMRAGCYATKRETVEAALKILAERKRAYTALLAMGGTVDWQGDLDTWRSDKPRPAIGETRCSNPATARAFR